MRLAIIPIAVLLVIGAALGGYVLYRQQHAAAPISVPDPPNVSSASAPVAGVSSPATPPLPEQPPDTPQAEKDQQELAVTPPEIPPTTAQLAPAAAATELLAKLPAAPPPVAGTLSLAPPIANLHPKEIRDSFDAGRPGGRKHEATDILAPRNTPVLAVDDGTIAKLFLSKPGGITVYQFNPAGTYCYYYAHLDHYAPGLKEGQTVKRGDVLGYVGSTGDADPNTPHLHFALFALGPEKKWWKGTAINPYPYLLGAVSKSNQ